MRQIFLFIIIWILTLNAHAQNEGPLTIENCYTLARQNYPLIMQLELLSKSTDYSIDNVTKGYLPQLSINGQATYQSAVTQIPIKLPGVNIETISKDQYKLYAELNQSIYDGGAINAHKESLQANAAIEKQKVEIELYKLKERINQLYFGILLVNEQLKQTDIVKKDLQLGIDKLNAAIANGIALKSSVDGLTVEQLRMDQKNIELKANRKAFLEMLGLFINQTLDENSVFEKPIKPTLLSTIQRPELLLFYNQNKLLDIQNKFIGIKTMPKVGFFIQAGYGRPALNMLNNEFTGYYIGGIRFNWSLSGLYTSKKERSILSINYSLVEAQKETFLLNTNMAIKQQNAEAEKYNSLFETDDAIILLRSKIKNASLSQLENGTITSSDYVREINAEDQAKQNKIIHLIQLLMTEYNQQTISGN